MKKLLLAATLSSFACSAMADNERFYAGGNLGFWNFTEGGLDVKVNVSSLEGVVGFNVWKMINIEGRLGIGLENSTESVTYEDELEEPYTLPTEYTLNNYASLYIKPELKNQVATFYALLGITTADAEIENEEIIRDLSVTGLSYGLGMGFFVTDSALVNLEYRNLVQDGDYKFQGFSLGFTMGF